MTPAAVTSSKSFLRGALFSLVAGLLAAAGVAYIVAAGAGFGSLALPVRALLVAAPLCLGLAACYPWLPWSRPRPLLFGGVALAPALLAPCWYFLVFLPGQAGEGEGEGVVAEQIRGGLITDSSSSGIIEVGFSYPIFAPTLSITNRELYTRHVNVFLRMEDANNESILFRAVRSEVPDGGLSVEATVRGMLGGNEGFLFIPVAIPPLSSRSGRLVFIISNLDDGTTFSEALGRAYNAWFQIRDPETGDLLHEFPLDQM